MGTIKNEVGHEYGKWLVLSYAGMANHQATWHCVCDCGQQRIIPGSRLREGASTQCKSCAGSEQCPKGRQIGGAEPQSLEDRFKSKYIIDPVTGCWNWTGCLGTQNYYAIMGESANQGDCHHKPEYGHRIAWEFVHGPIPTTPAPDGSRWECHHICHNRRCVFIEHLQLLSHKEHAALHRRTSPRFPLLNVPDAAVMEWQGFAWHRKENGNGWFWSAVL